MMRALPAALLATIAFALPAYAAGDPILARLAGDWTGRGTYRASPDAAPERIFCKVTNTLTDNGGALRQSGRCAVTSGSSPIDGVITAAGGGRYTGTLDSLASDGPAHFTGSGGGGRLTLNLSFVDARTHAPASSVTSMVITGSGYHLSSTRKAGGKAWTPTDISFTK